MEPAGGLEIRSRDGDLRASVAAVLAELPQPPAPVRGELTSTLPIGAGLSSSAAVHVVLALALGGLDGWELARTAQRAEHRALRVPSGLLDQAASVFGRAGHAVLLDFAAQEEELVPLPDGLAIVVVHSGVSRTLAASPYAERKRELDEGMPPRIRHVESESRRVREVAAALRSGELGRVGELFREGHESLRDDFEASTPELDALVAHARRSGALAARPTGGGFGGAIVALVGDDDAAAFAARMPAPSWITRGCDGAREL